MSDRAPAPTAAAGRESPIAAFLRRLLLVLLIGGGLIYAGFTRLNIGAYAAGADSSGYLNAAKLLKLGHIDVPQRQLPGQLNDQDHSWLYVPLGFEPVGSDRMTESYPIGLPFFLAATKVLVGWLETANWTIWAHALAGLALLFWLARRCGLPAGWAALAVLLMGMSPLYLQYSLQLMSDVPATVWTIAAIGCALLGAESLAWAVAAGVLTGVAVLVRPSNALIVAPAMLALGFQPRRWLAYALAGVPAAIVFLVYNRIAHGNLVSGGYGTVGEMFKFSYVGASLANYAVWLPVILTPLGVLALAVPFHIRRDRRVTFVLLAWMLAYAVFYAFYSCTHETWWYLRFLLPALPAAWIAALLVARDAFDWLRVARFVPPGSLRAWGLGLAAVAAIFAYDLRWNRQLATLTASVGERIYPDSVAWTRTQVPANAVVVAMQMSGSLYFYSDFVTLRWDSFGAAHFARAAATAAQAGRPLYALLQPWERRRVADEKRLSGLWTRLGVVGDVELWRYDGHADEPLTVRETR